MANPINYGLPVSPFLGGLRYTMLLPWLVLAACLAATLLLWNSAQQSVMQEMQANFDSRVREAIDHVEQRMRTYEQVLHGAVGLFAASGNIGRNAFHAYVKALDIRERHPGIQGVGVALIVPPAQKSKHIAAIRAEGFPAYAIRPQGMRGTYTAVTYVEPFNGSNRRVLGYDMFSDDAYPLYGDIAPGVRRSAMEQSRDTGNTTISGKVMLLMEDDPNARTGFMMYHPVYKHGAPHDTLDERRSNIIGWVYASFRMEDTMGGILGEVGSDVDIEIFDGNEINEQAVMFDPDLSRSRKHFESLFEAVRRIDIAGHRWIVASRSLEGFESRMNNDKPRFIAYTGSGASILLALLTWLLVYGRMRAMRDAREITRSEERLAAVIDTALDAVVETDAEGRISGWNVQAENIFGWPRAEAIGRMLHETIIPPQHREAHLMGLEHFLENADVPLLDSRAEMAGMHRDGREFPIEVAITRIEMNGSKRFSSFIRDITGRKQIEEELRLASLVYENSSEAMAITNEDRQIIAVNPAFEKMTGYAKDEVIGKSHVVFSCCCHDDAVCRQMWETVNTTGYWQGEVKNKRKNGEVYVQLLTINTILDADGAIHRYVAQFLDITRKKESEEVIWRQANFDALTGLPNRRMFGEHLEQEINNSREIGQSLALMFIDLDRFKEINDTLGHDMGDTLLKEAARRLGSCVRTIDTVARLGGDEFTVIMAGLGNRDSVEVIAQDILLKLAEPFRLGDETAYVSASIGITFYPEDAAEIDVLLKNADQAMYVSKNKGRNRYSYFTPSMHEASHARLRMTNHLHGALAAGQFRVYYQPIVELATASIHKAEALIRWEHPDYGLVSPTAFIPIAEETGLIKEIGDWVFREAARQVAQWRESHHAAFQVSVNKSPVQFRDDNHSHSTWVEYLQSLGLPGQSIAVEITEGLLLDGEAAVTGRLFGFRDLGIQVSIDDFGTGYSSLSYIRKFNIDYIKIDQSFVRNLAPDSGDTALCEAIIVMGHKLGLKVIAEGVETMEQRDLLAAAGCDYGQGYLFSHPLPSEEFEALLDRQSKGEDLPAELDFIFPDKFSG